MARFPRQRQSQDPSAQGAAPRAAASGRGGAQDIREVPCRQLDHAQQRRDDQDSGHISCPVARGAFPASRVG